MEIKLPSNKAFAYDTPTDCPKAHCVTLIVGKRGSGKTVSAINLIEKMKFDRVFAISPTIKSNKEMVSCLNIADEDVYEDPDDLGSIDAIKAEVEKERDDLEEYWKLKKKYDDVTTRLNELNDIEGDADALLEFYVDGDLQPPTHKYGGREPMMCLLLDDMMGSLVYSRPRKLNQLCIFHRHLGQFVKGGALGLSLFFLVQAYKTQSGGITRTIRNQATTICLFQSKNEKELEDIAEEVGGEVDAATFYSVYNRAIQEKHDFLFIDLHKKSCHPSMFRRNFNEFLLYDGCDSDACTPIALPPKAARLVKKPNGKESLD